MPVRRWGTRTLQEADDIGILGPILSMGAGHDAARCRLVAVARQCSRVRIRSIDPPATLLHVKPNMAQQVRILTQEDGGEYVIMAFQDRDQQCDQRRGQRVLAY